MANVLGHEIRNPLAAMKSSAYLLKEISPDDNEDIAECIDVIEREIATTYRICENMLGFSRKREPVKHPIDLNDLIEESFSVLEKPESVEVIKEYDQDLPFINIDKDEIRQVLTNLIKNGYEIMEQKTKGGNLTVKTQLRDAVVEVLVRDTGPGISAENMKKMFTPFFSTKEKGTGLGLAACQQIIERHEGKIWVESDGEGKGASFFIHLQNNESEIA
jgi:signal transduction histidine kinase